MISEIIEKWIKGILIDGITGNLSGLFDNVNAKVGEIASDVGSTPQAWNSGIFNMLRSLSETVVLPIAAAILALVMCHELIQMITEKNNMHGFDTSMFFRWIFKSAFAILIVSNTWNIVMGVFDATQSVVNQSSGVIIGETSSYFSKDKDMLGAEKAYAKLEQKLQRYLDTYEATHNYDEYHFYLDEIEHDPYVLISILSALHDGVFTLAEVQGELEMLFEKQYILTETVTMQIRYRTKMMVIIGPYGVPQVITYQEPYEYYICTVKLKNKDLSHLPVEVLTEEQLSAYSLYMRTLGNRPDLFGHTQYPNASTIKQPTYYDIPPEALKDDRFAAMMEEATKYIGYPYVWGGSSPSTSFDCSGYISWVLNHSGWNVGRQTAQGLYNLCTPVSAAQVKPGDLVFFKGTYDTPGVSHCGIYVGNSIMLHCGDPISYTNLNSKYWQEHFYSYGRLP